MAYKPGTIPSSPRELLECVSERRRACAPLRARIAALQCIQINYAMGQQWMDVRSSSDGTTTMEVWDEDWSGRTSEMKVVNNAIGRLVRQASAQNNAVEVRAEVKPLDHQRGFETASRARSAKLMLNGIAEPSAFTSAYRLASSLRWNAGSSLLTLETTRKSGQLDPAVVVNPDGSPVVIDDAWIRWRRAMLTDLVWEPTNTSPDLDDHDWLMVERCMSLRSFERQYGPIENYGIKRERLPRLGQIAAPYVAAANFIGGSNAFSGYSSNASEPGVRVVTCLEGTEGTAPGRFDLCWFIIDLTPNAAPVSSIDGAVMNWDDPRGKWGSLGRPVFKLDAFRREDAMHGTGIPGILMAHQDLVNLATSAQAQQMLATVHGHWLVDKRAANREEFVNQLNRGVGGVLSYESQGGTIPAPQFVHPGPPDQSWMLVVADLKQTMLADAHQTQQSMGSAKSHVPQDVQMAIMESGGVVFDQILLNDHKELSAALATTLGTVRRHIEQGGSVLAHLRDQHGFSKDDLLNVLEIDPDRISLNVRAVQADMTMRSADQRVAELTSATMAGIVSPTAMRYERASFIGRPLVQQDALSASFAERHVRAVIDGFEWPGVPSLDAETFAIVARNAILGLDVTIPEDAEAIRRLEEAIQRQIAIGRENPELQNPAAASSGAAPTNNRTARGQVGGASAHRAPGSIDPSSSPIGAAGGLPLGLAPSIA